jgi:hypothetical protein
MENGENIILRNFMTRGTTKYVYGVKIKEDKKSGFYGAYE